MSKFEYDIGVIGAGAAGLTVTAGAAQLGAKTLLVEKGYQQENGSLPPDPTRQYRRSTAWTRYPF